jgi:adenine phosphoribosyltransferase
MKRLEEELRKLVRLVPDFPQKGILFRDITPILLDRMVFKKVIKDIAKHFKHEKIDIVAGIESRGFILAAPVSVELGAGFVPVRKEGKLPYKIKKQSYSLEYGTASLEIHVDSVKSGQNVLIVDDVLATGGTLKAAVQLFESLGARICGCAVLFGIEALCGSEKLSGYNLYSILKD